MARSKSVTKPDATTKAKVKKAAEAAGMEYIDDDAEDDIEAANETMRALHFKDEALIGEVSDRLIQEAQANRDGDPWPKLSETRQRDIIERCQRLARFIVSGVVQAVADRGLPYMTATIEGGSFKMGEGSIQLKTVIDFTPENARRLASGSVRGVLVLASVAEFEGEASIKPQPDQPTLEDAADEAHDPETGELPPRKGAASAESVSLAQ